MKRIKSGEEFFLKSYLPMLNKNITDVFFDLDHTLWDFDRNSALAFQRIFQTEKIYLDVVAFIEAYEPINLQYWKKFRDNLITKEELRRGRLIEAFQQFNLEYSLSEIDFLSKRYIEELPVDNHLFVGTIQILEHLSPNYNLHIITNGFHEVQFSKLKNSGIQKYFRTITTSEEAGVNKPHSGIFELALSKASVMPFQSIMVGDSLEADIHGARNIGMNTLFFNYKNEIVPKSERAIKNLFEIKLHL